MEPRTLVLNSWMKPHSIITWQQAVCLVDILKSGRCIVVGKADTIESYEATVSSPSVTLQIPAVVRLRSEVRTHKSGVKFSRVNLYARDGYRCCYDGKKYHPRELTYDHVVPRAQGGRTTWGNIVGSCKACNSHKGSRTPAAAGLKMHFKPYTPRTIPLGQPLLMSLDTVPDLWKPYLGVSELASTG
jgi:5-methylcytosine-specific restriction endonuclease McrA